MSPVIIQTSIPSSLSSDIACADVSLTVSATAIIPARALSIATSITVLPCCSSCSFCLNAVPRSMPLSFINLRVPTSTIFPSTKPLTPCPGIAANSSGSTIATSCSSPYLTIAWARGCSEFFSRLTAACKTSFSLKPAIAITSVASGSPLVMVPVLSKTIVVKRWAFSKCSAPLIRMPLSAPLPVPTMMEVGVASPKAQGQAITMTAVKLTKARVKLP